MYILYEYAPYEGYSEAAYGPLEKIKEWLKDHPRVSPDDLVIVQSTDVNIYELCNEARQ